MLLLGHRGAVHSTAPENTLASVERALRQGADGVEVDVRVTSDGIAVCHHDPAMGRTAGDPRAVAQTSYADLPWIGAHRVPRLSEVIDLVAGRGRLVVELKTPSWPFLAEPVDAVTAVLRRHRLDHVTVSSFDRLRLRAVRRERMACSTALLGRPVVPLLGLLQHAVADHHPEVHPHLSSALLRPEAIADTDLLVTAWTVDRPADLALLCDAGAHGVISDDPAAARAAVPVLARTG
jgi:glycerophosphoryl diester phosphodiesterase